MGGSGNYNFDMPDTNDYNKMYRDWNKGSSKGYNYGGRDFSWYDTALGRGDKERTFESTKKVVGQQRNYHGEWKPIYEDVQGEHARDKFGSWWGEALDRVKEANEMAYQKVLRGEISADDYKKLTSQKGAYGRQTLGSFSDQTGKVAAFGNKQKEMQKAATGTKTAMLQLAPGIREQSSEVVKGLLKNQAKETLLGKV